MSRSFLRSFRSLLNRRLGISALTWIMTTIFSGLSLITGAFALESILSQEVEREVLDQNIKKLQSLSARLLNRCAHSPQKDCALSIIYDIHQEIEYIDSVKVIALITYPNLLLGGVLKIKKTVYPLNGKYQLDHLIQHTQTASKSRVTQSTPRSSSDSTPRSISGRSLTFATLPFQTGMPVSSLIPNTSPLLIKSSFVSPSSSSLDYATVHENSKQASKQDSNQTQEIAIPFSLPDGRRVAMIARFELSRLQAQAQKRTHLIWFILGLQTFIVSLFALFLSRNHLVRPLERLAALTYAQHDLKAQTPPPVLSKGPYELMVFQEGFFAMLERIKSENAALTQAHIALTHREGLATAGLVSASIMHEVGNPLASVLGLIEFLLSDSSLTKEQKSLLQRAFHELKRMRVITRQLIDLSRPRSHNILPVLLSTGVEWARGMLWYQPPHRDIVVEVVGDLEAIAIVDEEALRHALLNLFMNAAQAQEGSGEIRVIIESEISPPPHMMRETSTTLAMNHSRLSNAQYGVQLHIIDQGPGIAPEDREHIFEIFSSSKGEGGSGLGLAIASLLIEESGGLLWLNDSPPNLQGLPKLSGACFSIWLPTEEPLTPS